jgi:hypothetical protein
MTRLLRRCRARWPRNETAGSLHLWRYGVEIDPTPDPTQISLHALMGHSIPQTLRVMGQIRNNPVSTLIDSGSTHNFVQDRVARQLGLPTEPAHSFKVLVGNREVLNCSTMCPNIPLLLGSHEFQVDLFVLPLSGAGTWGPVG